MAQHGTAKAGHGGSAGGGSDGGSFKDDPAAEAAPIVSPVNSGPFVFGEGRSEAEAQLRNYLDLMSNTKPSSGFGPLDQLHARLNEEPSLLNPPEDEFAFGPFTDDDWPVRSASPHGASCLGYEYFDSRFLEIKSLVAKKDEGVREIAQIKASLGEILIRLEQISSDMPSGGAMSAVEDKLNTISGDLEAAREQSAADAIRISRAAEEILAAGVCMQEIPAKFEMAARHTVEGLGRTVAASASRAAVIAVSQVQGAEPGFGGRVEEELRTLNRQSRETGERTAAALDRVNNTLRDYLGRGGANASHGDASAEPPRRRTGLHVPISGNSAVYKRGGTGFGAAPAAEPRLDTIQLRDPQPSDPNLHEALREASKRHVRTQAGSKPEAGAGPAGARTSFAGSASFLDDDRGMPLGGIATVAFVLLMAAAALFYLHTKGGRMDGFRAFAEPPVAAQQTQASAAGGHNAPALKVRAEQSGPALLASADDNRGQQAATDDLKALEANVHNGDPEALFRVGVRFLSEPALGGAKVAARWLAKAASRGHSEAQFMLASLYERGDGVEKDVPRAIGLYQLAANASHVRAMHNLGAMLLMRAEEQKRQDAAGAARSYHDAAVWFERAAKQGFPDSQYNLALLYDQGLGIEQDLLRAYQWYVKAASAGVKEAVVRAEQLRRTLPSARNLNSGWKTILVGSWKPTLMDTKQSASISNAVKG
jgi:localization factor PodJL